MLTPEQTALLRQSIITKWKRSGMSKEELARRIGCSRNTVYTLLLHPSRRVSMDTMIKAAEALNIDISETLRSDSIKKEELDPETYQFGRKWSGLLPVYKDLADDFMDLIVRHDKELRDYLDRHPRRDE